MLSNILSGSFRLLLTDAQATWPYMLKIIGAVRPMHGASRAVGLAETHRSSSRRSAVSDRIAFQRRRKSSGSFERRGSSLRQHMLIFRAKFISSIMTRFRRGSLFNGVATKFSSLCNKDACRGDHDVLIFAEHFRARFIGIRRRRWWRYPDA